MSRRRAQLTNQRLNRRNSAFILSCPFFIFLLILLKSPPFLWARNGARPKQRGGLGAEVLARDYGAKPGVLFAAGVELVVELSELFLEDLKGRHCGLVFGCSWWLDVLMEMLWL